MMIFAFLLSSLLHPFHISVTNIHYKPKEKVVQVEQRIFLDDFEDALRAYSGNKILDITEDNQENISKLVSQYLSEGFSISSGGKVIDLVYLGNEIILEENVMWCYFEAEKVKKFERFTVINSILVEKYKDQENIIHYTYPDGLKRSQRTGMENSRVVFD